MTDAAATPPREPTVQNANSIAKDIAAAIAEHRLPPGTRLREEALARVYDVSRTKVRAALLMLSKDRLIDIVPDKGAFVAKPSADEARNVFAVRRVLEAEMVRELIQKATPADYRRLKAHLVGEKAALKANDPKTRTRLLGDFHVVLAEVAGNTVMLDIIKDLVARSSLIAMLYQSSHNAACSSQQHAKFLEAAISGDTDHAVRLMIEHLNEVEAGLQFDADTGPAKRDLVNALLMVNGT
jgi:DNA-binding GntR family transcriptional regulator